MLLSLDPLHPRVMGAAKKNALPNRFQPPGLIIQDWCSLPYIQSLLFFVWKRIWILFQHDFLFGGKALQQSQKSTGIIQNPQRWLFLRVWIWRGVCRREAARMNDECWVNWKQNNFVGSKKIEICRWKCPLFGIFLKLLFCICLDMPAWMKLLKHCKMWYLSWLVLSNTSTLFNTRNS